MAGVIPPQVRAGVLTRDGYQCWLCRENVGGGVYSLHHRQGRTGADPHRYSNLIVLCGTGTTGCHGWVTVHPAQAYDLGLSVPRLGGQDTRLVPIVAGPQVYALDDYGTRIPLGTNPDLLSAQEWAVDGLVARLYPLIVGDTAAGTDGPSGEVVNR